MEDRRILERKEPDLEAQVGMIADEFREGFEAVAKIPGRGALTGARRTQPAS